MFWRKSKEQALAEAKALERQKLSSEKDFLDQVHQEAENVQRLQALLTDLRRLKVRVKPAPTRKTKSSSRKRR